MVWLGSMHIRSLPFGFSFTRMLKSQSVGCVTGLMMPSSHNLFSSSFTLSNFATGTRHVGACTGEILGSREMCMGVPRGFPRPGLNTFEYCSNTSSFVNFPSGGSVCGVFPQLRVFRRHRSSNNPMLVRPSRREVVARYKAGRPQGNLSYVSFLFYTAEGYLTFGAHGFASVSVNVTSGLREITRLTNCWA